MRPKNTYKQQKQHKATCIIQKYDDNNTAIKLNSYLFSENLAAKK
jgi:hypothetical protein